jgi:hypothetical protein
MFERSEFPKADFSLVLKFTFFLLLDVNSTHHWEYSDMVLHLPLHCNICHTFLLTSRGIQKQTKNIKKITRELEEL